MGSFEELEKRVDVDEFGDATGSAMTNSQYVSKPTTKMVTYSANNDRMSIRLR